MFALSPDAAQPCPADPHACTPPAGQSTKSPAPLRGPWLMRPEDYQYALDCAWETYRQAKNDLAVAEAAFKNAPDDLASLVRQHASREESLEADIIACLKEWKPKDPCCPQPDALS